MSSEDKGYDAGFAEGYDKGFKSGFEAAKLHQQPKPPQDISYPPLWPTDPLGQKGFNCRKCGMFFEYGKAYGFVCPDPYCPTQMKITCGTTNTTQIKDPGEI